MGTPTKTAIEGVEQEPSKNQANVAFSLGGEYTSRDFNLTPNTEAEKGVYTFSLTNKEAKPKPDSPPVNVKKNNIEPAPVPVQVSVPEPTPESHVIVVQPEDVIDAKSASAEEKPDSYTIGPDGHPYKTISIEEFGKIKPSAMLRPGEQNPTDADRVVIKTVDEGDSSKARAGITLDQLHTQFHQNQKGSFFSRAARMFGVSSWLGRGTEQYEEISSEVDFVERRACEANLLKAVGELVPPGLLHVGEMVRIQYSEKQMSNSKTVIRFINPALEKFTKQKTPEVQQRLHAVKEVATTYDPAFLGKYEIHITVV